MNSQDFRKLVAEGVGTAFLLIAVVGSGIMAETLTEDVALALLANAIATGVALVVLIMTLGPVSGAHFNPAVTLVMWMRQEIRAALAVAYVLVQVASAILGVWCAHAMFDQDIIQISQTVRTGPDLWFAEIIATLGLVLFILLSVRYRPDSVAWVVGLYITGAYWFTASTSFANPAVTIARGLTDTFAGIAPAGVPVFIAMQIIGALMAAAIAGVLLSKDEA